jgi:hypothetical protein
MDMPTIIVVLLSFSVICRLIVRILDYAESKKKPE